MKQVEVVDVSAEFVAVGFFGTVFIGSDSLAAVSDALAPLVASPNSLPLVWQDPWQSVTEGGWQYSTDRPSGTWNYSEAIVPRSALATLEAAPGLTLARAEAWEALRIAAWRPCLATEGDEHLLPHELDWLRSAVHLSKGCYRGQETVAKVHNLGHPPRRLTFLDLDGVEVELPAHGALVLADGAEVGHVTAAANHYEDGPIALAVLKRNVATDAVLEVVAGDVRIPAHQVVIVPPEAGKEANVPRMPRLGRVTRSS